MYTMSCTHVAEEYLSGLLQCEKGHGNMERMVEKVNGSDYKRYIHFMSVSKWSAPDVNLVTMESVDSSLREHKIKSGLPTGLDVHKDELILLTEPAFSVSGRKGNKGKFPTKIQPDIEPIQFQNYVKILANKDFGTGKIRKPANGHWLSPNMRR